MKYLWLCKFVDNTAIYKTIRDYNISATNIVEAGQKALDKFDEEYRNNCEGLLVSISLLNKIDKD